MHLIHAMVARRCIHRLCLGLLLTGLTGCHWFSGGQDVLTRADYEQAQERRELALEQRIDRVQEALQSQFQRQHERLVGLDRRLLEMRERQAAIATAGDDSEQDADSEEDADDEEQASLAIADNRLEAGDKLVLGVAECVAFPQQQIVLRARVDSGAETSSLHAVDITSFERDGEAWVRFAIPAPGVPAMPRKRDEPTEDADRIGSVTKVEARVAREVRIRQTTGEERRYVVSLPIRIGSLVEDTEFTLTDRTEMRLPVLLGRRLMRDIALIDVGREYVQPCTGVQ